MVKNSLGRRIVGNPNVRYFQRTLTPDERTLLLAVGNGDPVTGWHNMLDVVRSAYLDGWRPGVPVDAVGLKPRTSSGTPE
jgi:hypothetical protein